MRFRVFTCESHQDLGIFAYVQPLYSHLCLLSHTCEYLLSYENRCWCDHKYFNISESVKFFKVLISVPKLDRKAWIFPTFFFVKILKFSKKSHICEAQEPHMWLYSHMWVRTVSLTDLLALLFWNFKSGLGRNFKCTERLIDCLSFEEVLQSKLIFKKNI